MAFLQFSYLKQVKPNQQTFTPGSAVTSSARIQDLFVEGLPAISGLSAASTLIVDRFSKTQYYSSKPFSAFYALASAATSDATTINFV